MNSEPEFTNEQLARMDEIHNAVYELCRVVTEKQDLEWSMAYIGEIADAVCAVLTKEGYRIRYPAMVIEDGHIEEYY